MMQNSQLNMWATRDKEQERSMEGESMKTSNLCVLVIIAFSAAIPAVCIAQTLDPSPLTVDGKFHYHLKRTISFWPLVTSAAYAGFLQDSDSPKEWGQGGYAYGKRFGSVVVASGIYNALAFGLDSTLHQDPRYFRSGKGLFLHRAIHALRGTILTHTDSGGETLSIWRIGAAYGSAYLAKTWYPPQAHRLRLGALEGSYLIGTDFLANLGSEFWPDIKHKVLHLK